MADPVQPSLSKQCVHYGQASKSQDHSIWHIVSPIDVEDAAEAVHVENVESLFLLCICHPCLTAIQQGTDDAGIVYCHLSRSCQPGVLPDTCGEPTKCCCSLSSALVDLCIKGPQVGELLYNA